MNRVELCEIADERRVLQSDRRLVTHVVPLSSEPTNSPCLSWVGIVLGCSCAGCEDGGLGSVFGLCLKELEALLNQEEKADMMAN